MIAGLKSSVPTVTTLIPKDKQTDETLITMYGERIGNVNEHITQRLKEYFMYVRDARETHGDWFFWCHKAIMDVATKSTTEQRTIAYLIGVYKSWLTYGFGTYYNAEFYKAVDLFTKQFKIKPSPACIKQLQELVNLYGIVYAVDSILNCEPDKEADPSMRIARACISYADENYGKEEESSDYRK